MLLSLTVGGTETLTATVSPSNATNKTVSWTTNYSDVATVSGGTVTAKSIGRATITVTTVDGNKTATCRVDVRPGAPTNVTATATSSSSITVSWSPVPDAARGYQINWGTSMTLSDYDSVITRETSYTLTGLLPSTTYYFQVFGTAYSGGENGGGATSGFLSTTVSAKTLP
jgi:transglutaminase/protease-like cytokinesis protein 3